MIATTWGVALILAQSVLETGHHAPKLGCCDECGVEKAAILEQIVRLQTCPNWRDRDRAAHALRRCDWRCHPEVVEVLALALLKDCHEEVREEAAESLTKMAPCLPVAHEALSRAANLDRDHSTRRWARRGLKRLAHRCEGACKVCGPIAERPIPGETVIGPPIFLAPGKERAPSIESSVKPPANDPAAPSLPEAIPGPSPSEAAPKLEGPITGAASSSQGRSREKPTFLGIRLPSAKR